MCIYQHIPSLTISVKSSSYKVWFWNIIWFLHFIFVLFMSYDHGHLYFFLYFHFDCVLSLYAYSFYYYYYWPSCSSTDQLMFFYFILYDTKQGWRFVDTLSSSLGWLTVFGSILQYVLLVELYRFSGIVRSSRSIFCSLFQTIFHVSFFNSLEISY